MLRISTKTRYGLRALISIASRQRENKMSVLSQIAEEQDISDKYLEHIVFLLRARNLLIGKRGVQGGYRLARPEEDINLLKVLEALEGPVELVGCITRPETCDKSENCITRKVWKRLQEVIIEEFKKVSLKTLVDSCQPDRYKAAFDKDAVVDIDREFLSG